MDLRAAVAACQAVHVDVDALALSLVDGDGKGQTGGSAAGTADGEDSLSLGITVDENPALQERGVQGGRALHADLLVHGENALQGRMRNVVRLQNGQRVGHGNAVVAAQSGVLRPDVFPVRAQRQGVLAEVDGALLGLLRHHIHVTLEDHRGVMLIAGGAVLVDDHVMDLVLHAAQAVLPGKAHQVVADLFGIPGAVGNLADFLKVIQCPFRLQARQNSFLHVLFLHFSVCFSLIKVQKQVSGLLSPWVWLRGAASFFRIA